MTPPSTRSTAITVLATVLCVAGVVASMNVTTDSSAFSTSCTVPRDSGPTTVAFTDATLDYDSGIVREQRLGISRTYSARPAYLEVTPRWSGALPAGTVLEVTVTSENTADPVVFTQPLPEDLIIGETSSQPGDGDVPPGTLSVPTENVDLFGPAWSWEVRLLVDGAATPSCSGTSPQA